MGLLAHRFGEDAIDADRSESERDEGEEPDHHHAEALRLHRFADRRVERLRFRTSDAATFAGAALTLAVLALAASLVPAWRATRVDPLTALRAQ